MLDIEEKIAQIQEEIRKTPYHKGTEHHIGLLRAKLAKLRSQEIEKSTKRGGSTGFAIPKTGDATCVLIGFPSVGKSTILAKLTAAKPKIAAYPFTTLSVIPGILNYLGAAIQILDVPGLVGGAAKGTGRGREVLSVARITDLLIIVAEAQQFEYQKNQILAELYQNGVRVNKQKPKITVKKQSSGGIKTIIISDSGLDKKQITSAANELGLVNAQIQIKEKISLDELIDAILANRVYLPAIFVASKIDLVTKIPQDEMIPVAAEKNFGLESLKEAIWEKLGLIHVYLKPENRQPDFNNPLILKYRSTVFDVASKVSKELSEKLKSAQILRNNLTKVVGSEFVLEDKDIITFLK